MAVVVSGSGFPTAIQQRWVPLEGVWGMRFGKATILVVLAALFMALVPSKASAESILDNEVVFTVTGSGPYAYHYTIQLTNNSILNPGDFFEIVDFNGLVAGSDSVVGIATLSADWTFSAPLFTGTVTNGTQSITVADDNSTSNLRWTYTGTALTNNTGASVNLGIFSASSINPPGREGDLMAKDSTISGGLRVNGDNPILPVPVPAVAFSGLALFGVLGASRVRPLRK
jgi:hypothetical protein